MIVSFLLFTPFPIPISFPTLEQEHTMLKLFWISYVIEDENVIN